MKWAELHQELGVTEAAISKYLKPMIKKRNNTKTTG
jgi:predicted transcriptional regulator